jgi:hypothetical protein
MSAAISAADECRILLEAMARDGARPMRSGPKAPVAGAALRKAVMAIWCVCFCGIQWRAIGLLPIHFDQGVSMLLQDGLSGG